MKIDLTKIVDLWLLEMGKMVAALLKIVGIYRISFGEVPDVIERNSYVYPSTSKLAVYISAYLYM